MKATVMDALRTTPVCGGMLLGAAVAVILSPTHRRWELMMLSVGTYHLRILETIAGPGNLLAYTLTALVPALALVPLGSAHIAVFAALLCRFLATVPMSGYSGTLWLAVAALQILAMEPYPAAVGAVVAVVLALPFLRRAQLSAGGAIDRVIDPVFHRWHPGATIQVFRAVMAIPPDGQGPAAGGYQEQLLAMPWQNQNPQALRRRPAAVAPAAVAPAPARPTEPPFPVKDEDVAVLTDMGYSREDSLRALEVTHGNLNEASNVLLDQLLN